MLGPKRFSDLRADLPGISANTLTQRLEGLEATGLVVRRRLPPPAAAQVYELTEWGYEAEPIVQVHGPLGDPLARARPDHAAHRDLADALLPDDGRSRADERAEGADRLPHRRRDLRRRDRRRPHDAPSAAGSRAPTSSSPAPAPAIAGAVYGGVPIEALEAEGALEVEGDRALAARFVTLFPLPPKASVGN